MMLLMIVIITIVTFTVLTMWLLLYHASNKISPEDGGVLGFSAPWLEKKETAQ